jgi:hypothetical protein
MAQFESAQSAILNHCFGLNQASATENPLWIKKYCERTGGVSFYFSRWKIWRIKYLVSTRGPYIWMVVKIDPTS